MSITHLADRLYEHFDGELRLGFLAAVQAFVAVKGRVICDIALGEAVPGQPASTRTTFGLHCATKPVIAIAIAKELEDRNIAPSVLVAEVLDLDHQAGVTIEHLVNHNAGLGSPDAFSCNLMDPTELHAILTPTALLSSAAPGVAEYSEIAA